MESPLKGTGFPPLETKEVFVSAYLDRLLTVDEDNYRWDAVLYFYNSWIDPSADKTVAEKTKQMLTNSTFECKFYCSNLVEKTLCCDDIYLPAFLFKNAYGFPQDREILYNIYTASDGSVMREVRVHGQFYQPMDFSHYPFDSFDLLVELRFADPTVLVDTAALYGQEREGVTVFPSSGGKKLYTYGKGDDASSWAVTDFSIEGYNVDMGVWFDEFSDLTSHPNDPMPLSPVNANFTGGAVDEETGRPLNVYTGVNDQLLAVLITIERFWKPSLINAVLPVILVYCLGMFVFACEESDLPTRLQIVVTLFLALAAVQFVVAGTIPTSSYVVPTQQLVLATYVFLFMIAVESIIVYHIVRWHQKREESKRRREAFHRYRRLQKAGMLAGGKNPHLSAADLLSPEASRDAGQEADLVESGESGKAGAGTAAAAAAAACLEEAAEKDGAGMSADPVSEQRRQRFGFCFNTRKGTSTAERGSPRRVSSFQHMTADEAYGEYIGHLVDHVFAVVLGLAYLIVTILIFTLQQGYIDLFAE